MSTKLDNTFLTLKYGSPTDPGFVSRLPKEVIIATVKELTLPSATPFFSDEARILVHLMLSGTSERTIDAIFNQLAIYEQRA